METTYAIVTYSSLGQTVLGFTKGLPNRKTEAEPDITTYDVYPLDFVYDNPYSYDDKTTNPDTEAKCVKLRSDEFEKASIRKINLFLKSKNYKDVFEKNDFVTFSHQLLLDTNCLGRIVEKENGLYSVNLLLPRLDTHTNITRLPFQLKKITKDEATMMFLSF